MLRVQPGLRSETVSIHSTMTIRKEINKASVEIQERTRWSAECASPIVTCAVVPSEGSAQLPFSCEPGPAREVDIGGGTAPGGNRGLALCPWLTSSTMVHKPEGA